jgi:hypothetical protein
MNEILDEARIIISDINKSLVSVLIEVVQNEGNVSVLLKLQVPKSRMHFQEFDVPGRNATLVTLGKIQNETSHLRLGFRSEIPNFHPLTFATFHLSILSVWRH